MTAQLEIPPASADPILHADYIEFHALFSNDKSSSFQEYARDIRISGTTDALTDVDFDEDPGDHGGEQSSGVAELTWDEIERRERSCGGEEGYYPFDVSSTRISLRDQWQSSPYIFQLLLERYGYQASTQPMNGARLFERVCSLAARGYLGGQNKRAKSYTFGFPRPTGSNFRNALEKLCREMGEGRVNERAPQIGNQKDSHLDIVAWLPFCDRKSAQLVAFGQCATGANWGKGKLTELVPQNFGRKWLREPFLVDPIRMFFIPRSIEDSAWRNSAIDGGIIFDRCRISWCAGIPDDELAADLSIWTGCVYSNCLGAI